MTMHDLEREQVPVFRRRRFSAPHRRRRLWLRLLRPLAVAIVLVAVPVASGAWIVKAPTFRVEAMSVSASGRVPLGWAEDRLAALRGRHILALVVDDVQALLDDHPWIRGVEVTKRLPARLEVRILERRAAALLKADEGLFFLDSQGAVIAPYDSREGVGDFVFIDAAPEHEDLVREALLIAETWERCSGPWAQTLSEVEALGPSSFRLHSSALTFPLLVTRDRLERGLEALRQHLPRINRQYPDVALADLRFREQLVFQRAVAPPMEG